MISSEIRRASFDRDEFLLELGLGHGRLEGAPHLGEIVLEEGLMAFEHLGHGFEAGRGIDLRGRDSVEAAHESTIECGDPGSGGIEGIEAVDLIEGDENGLVGHGPSPGLGTSSQRGRAGTPPLI
jgi:hypothetical protein